MSRYDDDDDRYDDDEVDDDIDDDDDDLDDDAPSSRPAFGSGQPRTPLGSSPTSSSSGGGLGVRPSGLSGSSPSGGGLGSRSNLPGSPPSGGTGSLGSRPSLPGSPPSGGTGSLGSRPGLPGSPPSGGGLSGSRPNLPGSPPSGGGLGGNRPLSPPASPPSGGGGSFGSRPGQPSSPPSSGGLGGSSGGLGGGANRPPSQPLGGGLGGGAKPADKKEDDKSKSGGGPLGGLRAGLGGLGAKLPLGGGGDKKDAPKGDKPAGGNPLGNFGAKLPFGKKDDGGAKKDDKPSGGGLLGGLGSRVPGFGGGDKKDAPASKPAGGGGLGGNLGGGLGGSSSQSALGANRSSLGGSGSLGGAAPAAGGAKPAAKDAKAGGGGLFSRLSLSLPFGGGAKKSDKSARPKTSKAPKVQQEGLSLDTKLDLLGVALLGIAAVILLSSFSSNQGQLTGQLNGFLSYVFGWGAIAIPIGMFAVGIWLLIRHFGEEAPIIPFQRVLGLLILYFTVLTAMQFYEATNYTADALLSGLLPQFMELSSQLGRGGGYIGSQIYYFLITTVGEIPGAVLLFIPFVAGAMFAFRLGAVEMTMIAISSTRNLSDAARQRAIRARAERTRREEERAITVQQAQLASGKVPAPALPAGERPALPMPTASPIPMPLSVQEPQRTIPIMQGGRTFNASVSPEEERLATAPTPAVANVAPPAPERGGLGRMIPAALAGGAAAAVKALTPTEETDEPKVPSERRGIGLGSLGSRLPFGGKRDEPATAPSGGKPGGLFGGRVPGLGRSDDKSTPAVGSTPALSTSPTAAAPPAQTPPPQIAATGVRPPTLTPPAPPAIAPAPPSTGAAAEEPAPRLGQLLRPQPSSSAVSTPAPSASKTDNAGVVPTGSSRPSLTPQRSGLSDTPFGQRPASTVATTPAASASPAKLADEKPEEDWASLPQAQPRGGAPVAPPTTDSPFAPRVMPSRTEGTSGAPTSVPKPASGSAPLSWQDRMAALSGKLPGDVDDEDEDDDKPAIAAASVSNTVIRSPATGGDIRQAPRILPLDEDSDIDEDDEDFEDDLPIDDDEEDDDLPMKPLSAAPVAPKPNPFAPPQRPASAAFGRPDTPPSTIQGGFRPASPPPVSPPAAPVPAPLPAQPAARVADNAGVVPTAAPSRPQPVINPPDPPSAAPVSDPPPPVRRGRKEWKPVDLGALLATGTDQELDHAMLLQRAKTIEETLGSFGAPGRVVEVRTGPVITQFGVEPDYLSARGGKKVRVKVGTIAQLDKDLQLALGAKSIRIEAPVPGKGYVGIEVPNDQAAVVRLRDVMESDNFKKIKSPLAIALGQGVDGTPVAADLTGMPHLLIAGTTGSGKSVCVNSIIGSLLLNNTPDRLKFIMVDPKRVELTAYNGIPHLVAPVVVELERIVGVLKWVTREMDERYRKFSNSGSRNIEDYNKHLPAGEPLMPYIVVIIDELADLMMLAPDETERVITRLAALARATGIHLVIATQRPSVDVVTGLIKANFPARIAFAVAGSVDSRVILDQPGAERLLGRGDMLYMSGDSPSAQRLQGVFVSDNEINNITRFWRTQLDDADLAAQSRPALSNFALDELIAKDAGIRSNTSSGGGIGMGGGNQPRQQAFWDRDSAPSSYVSSNESDDDDDGGDEDDLYEQSVTLVRQLKKASVSLLQRRLRIGYTRAAKLIDLMEERGVVGPSQSGSTPRDVIG